MRRHISYANVAATIALIVALSGTAVAAVIVSKPSQLGKGVVTNGKVKKANLNANRLTPAARAAFLKDTDTDTGFTKVITRAEVRNIPGSGSDFASATCQQGERLVGGHAQVDAGGTLEFSQPTTGVNPTENGQVTTHWYGQAVAGQDGSTLRVWALCAS